MNISGVNHRLSVSMVRDSPTGPDDFYEDLTWTTPEIYIELHRRPILDYIGDLFRNYTGKLN